MTMGIVMLVAMKRVKIVMMMMVVVMAVVMMMMLRGTVSETKQIQIYQNPKFSVGDLQLVRCSIPSASIYTTKPNTPTSTQAML